MRKLLVALLFAPALLHAQSLTELVRSAVAIDPAITAAEAQVRAAEQRLTQAKAGFGPTINGTAGVSRTRYTDYLNIDPVTGRGVRAFHSQTCARRAQRHQRQPRSRRYQLGNDVRRPVRRHGGL